MKRSRLNGARVVADARPRLEKTEQAETIRLLELIGATVYTIGTRRPGGRACPSCGTFVPESQGTRQTPGLPDLLVFLPSEREGSGTRPLVFIEQKAEGGRLSPAQELFRALVEASPGMYISGTVADVVAWLEARGAVHR